MAVMENVVRVGKTFKVRKRIPLECRDAFGVTGEFKTVSLDTTDKREAQKRAVPILADIDARIAEIRGVTTPAPTDQRLNPARVEQLIREWRLSEIKRARDDIYNGNTDNRDPSETSHLRYALQHHTTIGKIADFDARMADVLSVTALHPVVARQDEREQFRSAWHDVETFTARFATDIHCWDEGEDSSAAIPVTTPTTPSPVSTARPEGGLTALEIYDKWAPVASIRLEKSHRGYVQRLDEFLGSKPISQIEPHDMARFKAALLRFPLTKSPDIQRRTFGEIVAWGETEGLAKPRLDPATAWKWINTCKNMFGYAAKNRWIEINPADDTMKKPPRKRNARLPFAPEDIAEIFGKPAFTGFSGRADEGYRKQPGDKLVKDAKFWMPIIALYTGARMEEIGSTLVREIRQVDGVWVFDLLDRGDEDSDEHDRSIKNDQSRRIVPLHQKLIDLGRVDKVSDPQTDGCDEDEAEEAVGGLVVTGGQSAAVFQL